MRRRLFWAVTALGAMTLALPARAQEQDVPPDPRVSPATITAAPTLPPAAPMVLSESAVDGFYASRSGAPIWLRDGDSRDAAGKLVGFLRNAELDGLLNGPELAANVQSAIARGLPDDDKTISVAWVRYVRALKAPVRGIGYGDPALTIKTPSPEQILGQTAIASPLSGYVDKVAAINPFYSALREAAVKQGKAADPHVRATLDRLRLVPSSGRAILVDVANAELMLLEDGRVADRMKVIIGKPTNQTPLLAGTIHYVTFNPYWHIPQDVARRKVAPVVLKRGVSYLKAARYETVAAFGKNEEPIDPVSVDWKAVADGSVDVHIRQLSGSNNMMGAMKFGFVNDYGIFLHDTPHKDLFAKSKRNLSLGCVRVEQPERLAHWLLGRDPVPPSDGSEQLVQVDKGVPIFITYMTARPDGDQIAFADDVYGLDNGPQPAAPATVVSAAASATR